MSTEVIAKLKQERLSAWKEMSDLLKVAHDESRVFSSEEQEKFEKAETDLNARGKQIEAEERAAEIAKIMDAPAPTVGVPSGDPLNGREATDKKDAEVRERAFERYMRGGLSKLSSEERERLEFVEARDMGEASGAAGGYLVPPGFLAKITEKLKWYGGVRKVANVIQTATGQSLVWPSNDDTGNPAVVISENTQVSETDLAMGQRTLSAFLWTSGAIRIGRALMQDAAFDLQDVVTDRMGKRFGRGENTSFTLGTSITGGLTAATSALTGATSDPLVQGSAGATDVLANLLTVLHGIDVAYRQSGRACWMLNDNSLMKLQKIVDSTGRPIFIPAGSFGSVATGGLPAGVADGGNSQTPGGGSGIGAVDTLLGYPVVVNNDLVNSAASGGGVPVLFGDFKSGYIIRDVMGSTAVLRLDERYADYGQVGFIGYRRSDGNIDDTAAIRALTNHA